MKIKFLKDWMGGKDRGGKSAGDTFDMIDDYAKELIKRGTAEEVKKGRPSSRKKQQTAAKNRMVESDDKRTKDRAEPPQ